MGRPGWAAAGLARRTVTVLVGAPLLLAAVWLGGIVLAAVVLVLAGVGAVEYRRLATAAGLPASGLAVIGALVFPLLAAADRWPAAGAAVAIILAAAAVMAMSPARRGIALGAAAADLLGALYVGGLFAHLLLLRDAAGAEAAMVVLGIIWTNDIVAYGAGLAWGRRRLSPAISPGKTIEGFLAGVASAVAVALAGGAAVGWPALQAGVVGFAVALAAVLGDLWESALKRAAGVKDAGQLLPGHGGVLDRFDAALFGVPAAYYLWGILL